MNISIVGVKEPIQAASNLDQGQVLVSVCPVWLPRAALRIHRCTHWSRHPSPAWVRGHISGQCSASDSPGSTPGRPRPQSRGNGPGRCSYNPQVPGPRPQSWGHARWSWKVEEDSSRIITDSSAEEVGESLQDVERREERCDSKRLSNPAWLQSNSENFDCTSFTLLENIRTDCPHSSNLTFLPANQRCCPVQQTLSGWFKDDLFSLLISLVHPSFQVVSNITLHR